jgi:hypothetical protein
MNANLCCNTTPSTTTTSTTNGGGSVTPTAWAGFLSNLGPSNLWQWNACNGVNGGSIIVYTSTSVSPLPAGTALYSDAALTTLIPYSFGALAINGTVYEIQNGYTSPLGGNGTPCQFITTTTTTTLAPPTWGFTAADACNGVGVAPISYNNGSLCAATAVTLTNGDVWINVLNASSGNVPYFYVAQGGNVIQCTNPNVSSVAPTSGECISCSTPVVFTVENQRWGNTSNDACTFVNPPTTFYTLGPLQSGIYLKDGNVIYLDQALTQPVQYPYILSPGIGRLLDCNNGVLSNQRGC